MKAPITLNVGNMDRYLGSAIQFSHLLFTTILQELYLEASFTEMKLWHSRHAAGVFPPISCLLLHHFTPSSAPGSMCSWVEAEPLRWGFAAPQAGSCLLGGQTNQPTNQPQSNRDQQRGMGGGTGLTRLSKSTFRGAGGSRVFLGWGVLRLTAYEAMFKE